MAIGVDSSKWKPRKVKGTPAARVGNLIALGVLTFGVISGVAYHVWWTPPKLRKAVEKLYEDPIEEVERRMMIASGLPNRSGDMIRKLMEEDARTDLPHK
ncbi:unnamed protein product [Leptidea sinapis]|uniref:Uncharacterized protein n=1 Tax=Leptidea sinapis TaxID=189913 RepID=A0A5E4PPM9_9NEOP|nr:unnamed protein product [Leptidea sinapis]